MVNRYILHNSLTYLGIVMFIIGLFYSEDLVLRDDTGFILPDYRQLLAVFEFLFGVTLVKELIGKEAEVIGWFRRAPTPYVEVRKVFLKDGKTITSYVYPVKIVLSLIIMMLGLLILLELNPYHCIH